MSEYLSADDTPTRDEIDDMTGPVLLEFGTTWCGHCRAIAPAVAENLRAHPEMRHIKVEDGAGLPLGRSFGVQLWPTLVFLRDGRVMRQLVRPGLTELREAFGEVGGSGVDQPV